MKLDLDEDTNAYAAKANDMKASRRLGWKVDTSKQTDSSDKIWR